MSDWEYADEDCPNCGSSDVRQSDCWQGCDEGYYHDCGEDCCCCLEPDPNRQCDTCNGHGYFKWCHNCGYDLLKRKVTDGIPHDRRHEMTPERLAEHLSQIKHGQLSLNAEDAHAAARCIRAVLELKKLPFDAYTAAYDLAVDVRAIVDRALTGDASNFNGTGMGGLYERMNYEKV